MKKNTTKNQNNFFLYRGKPLVRCKDVLYYGDINDDYVVKITSKASKQVVDLKISTSVIVEMIGTDSNEPASKKILKISEKNGLYQALDIANIWLSRYTN